LGALARTAPPVRPSPRYTPLRRVLPPPSRSKRRTKRARAAVPAIPARPATRYALPPLAPETLAPRLVKLADAGRCVGQVPGESLLKVLVRRQRTRRSPRGVRFEPEVSADTSRSRPDTSAGATDTRGGGRLTPRPALSRRPCRLNFVIALLPALNVRVPTSHPVPQAKPGSIHPPWAWEASPTTVSMPATAPKGASTSRKVRDPESVNHPPLRSACAHPTEDVPDQAAYPSPLRPVSQKFSVHWASRDHRRSR